MICIYSRYPGKKLRKLLKLPLRKTFIIFEVHFISALESAYHKLLVGYYFTFTSIHFSFHPSKVIEMCFLSLPTRLEEASSKNNRKYEDEDLIFIYYVSLLHEHNAVCSSFLFTNLIFTQAIVSILVVCCCMLQHFLQLSAFLLRSWDLDFSCFYGEQVL